MKIFLTSGLTVIGGVFVFVVGQILTRVFIEPIHQIRMLIGEIADSLIFYSNLYTNVSMDPTTTNIGRMPDFERRTEASDLFRRQSSLLRVRAQALFWYGLWQRLRIVPRRTDIEEASRNLTALSNSMHRGDPMRNDERAQEIKRRLRIKVFTA